jgi:hypothetical protein
MSNDPRDDRGVGHILNEAWNPKNRTLCPTCGKDYRFWHVENYDETWRDGDVVCECGTRIRGYDAG